MATSLERFAQSHECATCQGGSVLTVRWSPEMRAEQVWCPRCRNTERFTRPKSLRQRYRDGESLPIAVVNRFQKQDKDEIEEVAAHLPPELAAIMRERALGTVGPRREERETCQSKD